MVFDHTHSLDVIPRGRLMTKKALIQFGVRLSRERGGHHGKMHHVVARRGLVALSALGRACGWMNELRDRPLSRGVALRAVGAEETLMSIFACVAADALEHRLVGSDAGVHDRQATRAKGFGDGPGCGAVA